MNILSDIVCVNLDIHLWTARRKLSPEDLGIDISSVPPSELASLGSKRVFDPESLKPFERIKKEAERILSSKGVRFLGGYAIPLSSLADSQVELNRLRDEFKSEKDKLKLEYTDVCNKWIAEHQKWADAITKAVVSWDVVDRQLNFGYQTFQVNPVATEENAATDDGTVSANDTGLEEAVGGLLAQLYREVAKEATMAWEKSIQGRDDVTRRALSPLKRIARKMEGLAFLDSGVSYVVGHIDTLVSNMPKTGKIDGAALQNVAGMLLLLQDPSKIHQLAEKLSLGNQNHQFADEPDILEVPVVEVADVSSSEVTDVSTEVTTLVEQHDSQEEDLTVMTEVLSSTEQVGQKDASSESPSFFF